MTKGVVVEDVQQLIRGEDSQGNPMVAIMSARVRLSEDRVAAGFAPYAFVTVFANLDPFIVICLHRLGKHYHVPLSMHEDDDPESVMGCMRTMAMRPDIAIEQMLQRSVDTETPEEWAECEVQGNEGHEGPPDWTTQTGEVPN